MYKYILAFGLMISSLTAVGQDFEGKILDSISKEGIPFAQVVLVDQLHGTKCDADGNFHFEGTFPSRVNLKISAFGYETRLVEIEPNSSIVLSLFEKHVEIDEVIASGNKNDLQRNSITHIEMRSIKELNSIPSTNLGQAIENIPGVYNTSTGNGVSKPVIRGIQGTRVVTMLNGIRIENQQWGGDHGMGLTDLGIAAVEVVKGPASLLYGADALGGVIYYTNESFASQNSHELKISSQFESNSMGTINSIFYKGARKGMRLNIGGRFNSQADYQLPNANFARNSRFQEGAGKASLGWSKGKWIANVNYSYSAARIGIPGESEDSVITAASFQSNNRARSKSLPTQYFINHIASFENKFVFKKSTLDILTGFTHNDLEEYEDTPDVPSMGIHLSNVLYTIKMNTKINDTWSVIYGVQGMRQWQQNGEDTEERLVPNAQQMDNGIFANVYLTLRKWRLQAGVRGDVRQISSSSDTIAFPENFNKNYQGYNFAVGGVYNSNKHTLRINVSSGFRVPHLSELLSNGVHEGTFRYEKGDRNLTPEKAIQLDLGYEFGGEHLSFILNPFISRIQDYITINPSDSVIDGFQVFNYGQVKEAFLTGIDLGFHYHPHFAHFMHVESSYSYIRGTSATSDLSLMPQARINSSLIAKLQMKSNFKISEVVLQHVYYFPQNFVSQFETKSSDYSLFNLGLNLKWESKAPIEIQVGVRNIFNTTYINHLSRLKNIGLSSPGRNVYVKLVLNIEYKEKK